MALWRCLRCTTVFAVGLHCCPQCTSTECVEEGAEMPKITRHGGPSNAPAALAGGGNAPAVVEEVGEQPSPGNSSSTSDEKPPSITAPSEADHPKPAPTTGSRSTKGRAGSGSARSTATNTPATGGSD